MAAEVSAELDQKSKDDSKLYYDLRAQEDILEPGEEVLVLHPAGPRGISAQWLGPYVVEERLSPVSYRLATPGKKAQVMHRNHLKRFIREYPVNLVVLAEDGEEFEGQLQLEDPLEDSAAKDDLSKESETSLTQTQKEQLKQLLDNNQDIFSTNPGRTNQLQFTINMGQAKPVIHRPYRIHIRWKEKVAEEIKTLLHLGIIRKEQQSLVIPNRLCQEARWNSEAVR